MTDNRKLTETEIEGRKVALYSRPCGDMEIFVEGIHGMTISPHLVKFNVYTVNPFGGSEGQECREVAARLVMTLPTFVAISQFLTVRVKELSDMGLITFPDDAAQKDSKKV